MESAHTYGLTADSTKENGCKIKCMEKDSIDGKMAVAILDSTNTIRSMDSEHTLGQMVEDILATGLIASDMVKEKSYQ